jgi:Stem cell factor.
MYLKTTNRIQSLWDKAQAQHKDNFNLIMKNGKKYIVKNFSPNNGFTVFDNNFKVLAYDISNIDDLANCILSISKSKEN